jgi:hypothetical protein
MGPGRGGGRPGSGVWNRPAITLGNDPLDRHRGHPAGVPGGGTAGRLGHTQPHDQRDKADPRDDEEQDSLAVVVGLLGVQDRVLVLRLPRMARWTGLAHRCDDTR